MQVFLAWLLVKEGFNRTVETPGELRTYCPEITVHLHIHLFHNHVKKRVKTASLDSHEFH